MDKINLIGKYIGPLSIINFREIERKTYLGRDIIELEFNDKSKREYPVEDLKTLATKDPLDFTALRDKEILITAVKVLKVLADSELPINDPTGANIQFLINTVIPNSIAENRHRAYGKLFSKDYEKITLADVDRVLTDEKFPEKKKDGIIK